MALLDKVQGGGGPGAAPPAPSPAPGGSAEPMQGAGGQPPGPESAPPGGGAAELPEEEQDAQIGAFLDNAYKIIYGGGSAEGEINPRIMESLSAGVGGGQQMGGAPAGEGADPGAAASAEGQGAEGAVAALAATAATVGASVAGSAAQSGKMLDGPGVVLPGTLSLVEDLAGVAEKEGIHSYSDDEMASAAVQAGELLFQQTQDLGLWNQAEMEQGVQEMMVADKAGVLDQMEQGSQGQPPQDGGGMGDQPPGGMA